MYIMVGTFILLIPLSLGTSLTYNSFHEISIAPFYVSITTDTTQSVCMKIWSLEFLYSLKIEFFMSCKKYFFLCNKFYGRIVNDSKNQVKIK